MQGRIVASLHCLTKGATEHAIPLHSLRSTGVCESRVISLGSHAHTRALVAVRRGGDESSIVTLDFQATRWCVHHWRRMSWCKEMIQS